MPDASPGDELTNPETGEPVDLSTIKFVSLTGNNLTVYLPTEMEWYKGPEGERRAREIGGSAVNFQNGLYPPGDQNATYEEVKLLIGHEHYNDLFKVAAEERNVSPTTPGPSAQPEAAPEPGEEEVMVNGEVMTKSEALDLLASDDAAQEDVEPVPEEPTATELTVLTEPTNKGEALEALANEGVDMTDAPPASAASDEIQQFAVERGYAIEKYDLPE